MSADIFEWDFQEGLQVSLDIKTKAENLVVSNVDTSLSSVLSGVGNAIDHNSLFLSILQQYREVLKTDGERIGWRTNYIYEGMSDLCTDVYNV